MIETKYIVGAGVLLGVFMLVAGQTRQKQVANPGTDVINAVYQNAAMQAQYAPALLNAASEATAAQVNAETQRMQVEMAGAEANKNLDLSFLKQFSSEAQGSQAQTLSFTGNNLTDYRKNTTERKAIASNEKVQLEKIKADKAVAMAQIDLQKKAQDNAFTSSIIGGVTGGLNPGQSLTGTSMGQNSMSGASGSNILSGLLQSLLGGSNGGLLSGLGGGVSGGSQGSGSSGGSSIISSIIPAVLAML